MYCYIGLKLPEKTIGYLIKSMKVIYYEREQSKIMYLPVLQAGRESRLEWVPDINLESYRS
jgi:hypothetical protein